MGKSEAADEFECPVCKSCGEFYCGCGGDCTPTDPRCRYGASLAQQAAEDRISQAEYEATLPPEAKTDRCRACDGKGRFGDDYPLDRCLRCHGTGKTCRACDPPQTAATESGNEEIRAHFSSKPQNLLIDAGIHRVCGLECAAVFRESPEFNCFDDGCEYECCGCGRCCAPDKCEATGKGYVWHQ